MDLRCGILSVLFTSIFIGYIHAESREVVVLDTLQIHELDWASYPDNRSSRTGSSSTAVPTWMEASWTNPLTGTTHPGLHVCSVSEETVDNWVRTPFIELDDVSTVYVNISFFMRECQEYPGPLYQCRTHFNVLKYESDIDFATDTTPSWTDEAYTPVITVPADHTYVNSNSNILANNYSFPLSKSRKGFYLAIRDRGMCGFILSVKVFYRRCPETVIRHTSLRQVPATDSIETVYGTCVENAVQSDPTQKLQFLCTHEGEWFNPTNSVGCVCKPGFEPAGDGCSACPVGTFKSVAGNEACRACPDNSVSNDRGLAACTCRPGYYRNPQEDGALKCTQPPSRPLNLRQRTLSADSITLIWSPPEFLGGRSDLFYKIECPRCSKSVTYAPSQRSNVTSVTIANLVPDSNYVVTIIAENGVSEFAPVTNRNASIAFKTLEGNSISLDPLTRLESKQNSLTVSWAPVKNAVAYDVMYHPVDKPKDRLIKRVTEPTATLENLQHSTAYNITVNYFDDNNQRIGVSASEIYQTAKSENPLTLIAIAIVAVVVCMAIVIVIVVMFLRRTSNDDEPATCANLYKNLLGLFRSKQQCSDKPHSDCEGLGPYTNVPFHITPSNQSNITLPLFSPPHNRVKTYVDPHTYEDPRQAVKEFTKEIDVSMITIEAVIGGGEFGDVCRGKLKCPNKPDMCVAIKTLKPGASEKNRLDFLTEASIMGQFDDQNVIFLEGVVTKSNPIMIVTEYMENGSLDTFLRANDGKLTNTQLLGMLRGIASGMTYLSDMSYVHRDLAARNILVNENLVCKVADFGLSREVEYDTSEGAYTTRGGKIPVRWTAPEAIAYRKFTNASDVWSFGVVMWEVMSYGERPYWNWSNQDVIKAVDRGYRLPPPMDCPEAVHQLMLDCWQKDRKNRPKLAAVRNTLDRLMASPELLRIIAKPSNPAAFDPEMPGLTSQMTVSEWLQAIKMDRYTESFSQKGIHSMEQVAWLTFADLLEMGVTLVGHQKKIMSSVQALRTRLDSGSPIHMSEGFLV